MYKIELLKLFKRRYNYIYFLFVTLFGLLILYQKNKILSYLEIENTIFFYNYFLKILLLSILLISIINVVISYIEDFKSKVIILFNKFNISSFKNVFSKIFINFIFFSFYYIALLLIFLVFKIVKKEIQFSEILNNNSIYYLGYSLLSILFGIVLVMFILSIFNNTNLALSLTLLYFLGSKFLASYLKSINTVFDRVDYIFINIFNVSFGDLSLSISKFNINSIFLVINISIIFIFTLLFNRLRLK